MRLENMALYGLMNLLSYFNLQKELENNLLILILRPIEKWILENYGELYLTEEV